MPTASVGQEKKAKKGGRKMTRITGGLQLTAGPGTSQLTLISALVDMWVKGS